MIASCGYPEDAQSPYPKFTGGASDGEKNFAALINENAEGKPKQAPWAGFWWPYKDNGIASTAHVGWGSRVRIWKPRSAAEKYDEVRGGRSRAASWEKSNHGKSSPGIEGWWGHCNGWSAAAGLLPEPKRSVKYGGQTFEVRDIKALLTEAAMEVDADFFGNRVDYEADYRSPKFPDTVPNQLFLVLTNYMGRLGSPVLIDRSTGYQVWNHPLAGYRFEYPKPSDYLGASPEAPGVHRLLMTATIWWARDDVDPGIQTTAFSFADGDAYGSRELQMELWLDGPVEFDRKGKVRSAGNLIITREGDNFVGGAWQMGDEIRSNLWPDYVWVPYEILPSNGYANPHIEFEWVRKNLLLPSSE